MVLTAMPAQQVYMVMDPALPSVASVLAFLVGAGRLKSMQQILIAACVPSALCMRCSKQGTATACIPELPGACSTSHLMLHALDGVVCG